jgi:hypothetical protein
LNVEAFHLTSLRVDLLEGNAPARYSVDRCQKKTTARRSIRARQTSNFFGETLEAKVYIERSLIFAKELPHLLELRGSEGLFDLDQGHVDKIKAHGSSKALLWLADVALP